MHRPTDRTTVRPPSLELRNQQNVFGRGLSATMPRYRTLGAMGTMNNRKTLPFVYASKWPSRLGSMIVYVGQ